MDVGWISIDDDYKILVREDRPDHEDYRFIGGYEGERIHLPAVDEAAPDVMYLREHRKLMGFNQGVILAVKRKGESSNALCAFFEFMPRVHQLQVNLLGTIQESPLSYYRWH